MPFTTFVSLCSCFPIDIQLVRSHKRVDSSWRQTAKESITNSTTEAQNAHSVTHTKGENQTTTSTSSSQQPDSSDTDSSSDDEKPHRRRRSFLPLVLLLVMVFLLVIGVYFAVDYHRSQSSHPYRLDPEAEMLTVNSNRNDPPTGRGGAAGYRQIY